MAKAKERSFLEHYNEVRLAVQKQMGVKSTMAVPRLEKVVLSMGMGDALSDKKLLDNVSVDIAQIAGQKPIKTLAKKSIAAFKVRKGQEVGLKVTLRGQRMLDFVERLIKLALPRVRDFRGVSSKSFDGQGNYSLGVKEHIIFSEIDYDKITRILGFNVNFSVSGGSNQNSFLLLKGLGLPFRK